MVCKKKKVELDSCRLFIYVSLVPHSPQKLVLAGFLAPHLGHTFNPNGAPQLLQNLPEPAGFPHTGHVVCLCVISPVYTWVVSAFCLMSVTIFSALAAATSVLSLGASSMHSPSCSFQSFSQTYLWHLGHLWK